MTRGHGGSALQQLVRALPGPPREVLRHALALAADLTQAEAGYVAVPTDGGWSVPLAVTAEGVLLADGSGVRMEEGASLPLDPADPAAGRIGVLLPAGRALDPRDRRVLGRLAHVARPLVGVPGAAARTLPRTTLLDLERLAEAVDDAVDLESLSRPLLASLQALTGLASTYLTVIHEESGQQEIRYALNTRDGFALPEGLHVPWADTLCKRALDEGQACTTDVPAVWGDSEAARELGIQVYVSVPVRLASGELWGTLCAADSKQAEGVAVHLPTMRLFSRLIAAEVERARAVARARAAEQAARTDPLTGVASRVVVEPWLELQLAERELSETVVLAFVDVDAFKAVNDALGHAAGDAVLVEVGRVLRAVSRPGDLVARLGGDEFVLGARLPVAAVPALVARLELLSPVQVEISGELHRVSVSVGVVTADDVTGGTAAALLDAADLAMYARKRG